MLADIKFRWTNQVADIFHDQQIENGKIKSIHRLPNHIAVEMAGTVRVDLDGLNAFGGNALGIEAALNIPFDYTDAQPVLQPVDGFFQKAGLACSGARHQIDDKQMIPVEYLPILIGDSLIGF